MPMSERMRKEKRMSMELMELRKENARLRDFVGWVAAPARFKDGIGVVSIRARELLNELEVTA